MVEQTCSSFTIKNDYGSEVSSQIDAWPQGNQQISLPQVEPVLNWNDQ